ncbi:endonuclease [Nocardia sp. CDC160]|uniref:endonuclease n=1 Tax=Nocardia sp. CDC160 TaxID=3112166 RepID=UPI002DBEAC85|nr:endonuclease [Nocardia sp. CDC160]MEC3920510.1 endonuclease [Nocardia sp. CDC160]
MNDHDTVRRLLHRAGTSYAAEAGIRLADRPAPLFQLLMLAQLLGHRISADIAVAAARELLAAGYTTPRRVAEAEWSDLVLTLGRAHFVRYDESTATRLIANASDLVAEWSGDMRGLAAESEHDPARLAQLLQHFKGIGPVGADIYLREVQDTWTWVRPYFDDRARRGASDLDLPTDAAALDRLNPTGRDADLAAALVRVTLDHHLRDEIRSEAR